MNQILKIAACVTLVASVGFSAIADNGQVVLGYDGANTISVGDLLGGDGPVNNLDLRTMDVTRARIDQFGRFGIGTTSPSRTLDVNGAIRGTAVEGNGIFPVTAYGATPNPSASSLTAFTNALNAAAVTGGTVLIPPGQYIIDGPLTIPDGVTLKGAWSGPHDADLTRGTTLRTAVGENNANGTPFITLGNNSSLVGVTIYYPNQPTPGAGAWTPLPYSWTISGGFDQDIIDVTLANSFRGINLTQQHERHYLKNVNITAFSQGVVIDRCTDIGRLENVHIHNRFFWTTNGLNETQQAALNTYTMANLTGFTFGTVDWEMVSGSFVIWASTGMLFVDGGLAGRHPHVLVSNSGVDVSVQAVRVLRSNPATGLQFTNCQFIGEFNIDLSNTGPVKINNSNFGGGYDTQSRLLNKTGPSTLSVSNSRFEWWGMGNQYGPAINLTGGASSLSNLDFTNLGTPLRAIDVTNPARANISNIILNGHFAVGGNGTINQINILP